MPTNQKALSEHLTEDDAGHLFERWQIKNSWPSVPYKWDDLQSLIADIYEQGFQDGYKTRKEGG